MSLTAIRRQWYAESHGVSGRSWYRLLDWWLGRRAVSLAPKRATPCVQRRVHQYADLQQCLIIRNVGTEPQGYRLQIGCLRRLIKCVGVGRAHDHRELVQCRILSLIGLEKRIEAAEGPLVSEVHPRYIKGGMTSCARVTPNTS